MKALFKALMIISYGVIKHEQVGSQMVPWVTSLSQKFTAVDICAIAVF